MYNHNHLKGLLGVDKLSTISMDFVGCMEFCSAQQMTPMLVDDKKFV